jgi:hypothetical protein
MYNVFYIFYPTKSFEYISLISMRIMKETIAIM